MLLNIAIHDLTVESFWLFLGHFVRQLTSLGLHVIRLLSTHDVCETISFLVRDVFRLGR